MLVKLSSLAVISPYTPLVVYPKLRELHVSYKLSTTQVQGKSVSPNSLKAMSEIRDEFSTYFRLARYLTTTVNFEVL